MIIIMIVSEASVASQIKNPMSYVLINYESYGNTKYAILSL